MSLPVPNPPGGRRAAISWSAGKDSWLALMRAREAGLRVDTFMTMCDPDGASKSHALPPALVEAQVRALGGEPRLLRVPDGGYAAAFDDALCSLAAGGHDTVVFGDVDLQAHRDWLEPACARAGLGAHFPLWRRPRAALARELLDRGVRARVVCVDTSRLDAAFCGRLYDAAFLADLPAGVCPVGEDGEFHTFVEGGAGFSAPLRVRSLGQRRVASRPPFAPTTFVFERLELAPEGLR
jgi:uncharacterized protein (TIGR00290 family)